MGTLVPETVPALVSLGVTAASMSLKVLSCSRQAELLSSRVDHAGNRSKRATRRSEMKVWLGWMDFFSCPVIPSEVYLEPDGEGVLMNSFRIALSADGYFRNQIRTLELFKKYSYGCRLLVNTWSEREYNHVW